MLDARLAALTVPSSDDRHHFVQTERLTAISDALAASAYRLAFDEPLAKVYQHRDFRRDTPFLLVSSHADSLYGAHFYERRGDEHRGTFDNSACNAVLVELMARGALPAQALIAFTGDEEDGSRGAKQVLLALGRAGLAGGLELCVVLDVTEAHYGKVAYTIENCDVQLGYHRSLLGLRRKRQLRKYLASILHEPTFVKDGDADETDRYNCMDVTCFSLCLPCWPLKRSPKVDPHDDAGIVIRDDAVQGYLEAVTRLTNGIAGDLDARASERRCG